MKTSVIIHFDNRQRKGEYVELESFGTTSIRECKAIVEKFTEIFQERSFSSISIDLSNYNSYDKDGYPIFEDGYTDEKTATYSIKRNRLKIFEDGIVVYENDNGDICNDKDALADTYH